MLTKFSPIFFSVNLSKAEAVESPEIHFLDDPQVHFEEIVCLLGTSPSDLQEFHCRIFLFFPRRTS